ncbi:ABC transporter substrate-binding protein [Rariglobus hedericola]|uniref:ABC transporter substrate-binding protein n=1 Tax=Rariglobus hedericola TaxID=2597822 RepID=UPI001396AB3D|nr:ABC transporter substrate-binding protein [Rariglobus hedericola]
MAVSPGAAVAQTDEPLDVVRLQLKWRHQFQFAGYYAAVAKGYYRDAGMDVQLLEAVPGKNPVEAVFAGEAEFGVGNSDLLLSRAEGKPAVVLAAIFQHSPLALVARAVPGITAMPDLHNRPMMMVESEKAELLAYFKHEGVNLAGLRIQPHTQRIEDFIDGKVDAMSAYVTDQPFMLKQAGVSYLTFVARTGGIDFYGDNLFTTESQVREYPERVRAFRAASLRGWDYALAHPEEIVDLILSKYTTRHSREHLLFEAAKTAELMHPGIIEVGHNNPGRWRHIAQTYAEFGLMPADFDLTGFLYHENQQRDLTWVYWSLGALGLIAVGSIGWLLPLIGLNRRLKTARNTAESANTAKSRYLAFISHEIRTPLNGIMGVVQLLRDEGLTKTQLELVSLIEQCAESLLKLINGLLDQAQIESGRLKIEILPLPTRVFVAEICELFSAPARVKGLKLEYAVDADVPAEILTDGLRLRQILSNLLSNAVKFTEAGGVTVQVSVQGDCVRLRVSDTGIGVSEEQRRHLFTPYAQADESISRRFGGTGLGLAISRDLARLLGGDITAEAREGGGAVFVVEIHAPAASAGGVV